MELRVNEVKLPEAISFNYEELKTAIAEKANEYAVAVYSEDQMKNAKADRATLNKLKKALNDERIRQEKEYMKPFNDFKTKINELIGIIDNPVKLIDTQIKGYEEKQKEDKLKEIKELYRNTAHPEWLNFEKLFNEKWLNASVKIGTIEKEIWDFIDRVENDLQTLSKLPEYSFEAIEAYKVTLNLNSGINEAHRLSEVAKRKAEMERLKAEAEARAKAEAEERAKAEAEMKAKAEAETAKHNAETIGNDTSITSKVEEPAPETKVQEKQWISFKAFLTKEDAYALRDFFSSRNIEFKAI